jgi:hypothetical protein
MASLDRIAISPRGRAMWFGMTGTGKSTVKERLTEHWRLTQPLPRVLMLDSKPRFRAEWELNGTKAFKRYKKWQRGTAIPGSVRLPFIDPKSDLEQVWRLGFSCAIAQTSEQYMLPWLRAYAHEFYGNAEDKYSQLLDVDEVADFFSTTGMARQGDSLLKIVRSGREMNVAFTGAAQRPKGLPHSFLTELSEVGLFALASVKDLEHLSDMGLPGDIDIPTEDHVFYHFRRRGRVGGMYRLDLHE